MGTFRDSVHGRSGRTALCLVTVVLKAALVAVEAVAVRRALRSALFLSIIADILRVVSTVVRSCKEKWSTFDQWHMNDFRCLCPQSVRRKLWPPSATSYSRLPVALPKDRLAQVIRITKVVREQRDFDATVAEALGSGSIPCTFPVAR